MTHDAGSAGPDTHTTHTHAADPSTHHDTFNNHDQHHDSDNPAQDEHHHHHHHHYHYHGDPGQAALLVPQFPPPYGAIVRPKSPAQPPDQHQTQDVNPCVLCCFLLMFIAAAVFVVVGSICASAPSNPWDSKPAICGAF